MSGESSTAKGRRRSAGRLLAHLIWYGLPGIAALAVAAYIAGAILWHVNPPIVPVAGVSMRPTLQPGDLVVLKGVDPTLLRKGDIVAVHVPSEARSQYGLPGAVVHRIVRIEKTANGLLFVTKGDANVGNDVFTTPAPDVIGREVAAVPGLGYPFLFFRSKQGEIFAAAVVAVGILYFLLGAFEERRAFTEGTAVAFETILAETKVLKETLAGAQATRGMSPFGGVPPLVTSSGGPVPFPLDELAEEVRDATACSRETSEVTRELVGAIGEYGTHLRSHTEVMVNLAATTRELQEATAEMREAIAGSVVPGSELESTESAEPAALPQAPSKPPRMDESSLAVKPLGAAKPEVVAMPPVALRRAFRGYSPESVEALLATLARRLEEQERRLAELVQRNAQLERDVARYKQIEASTAETRQAAGEAAAELRQRAKQQEHTIVAAPYERPAEVRPQPADEQADPRPTYPGPLDRRDDIGEAIYLPEA